MFDMEQTLYFYSHITKTPNTFSEIGELSDDEKKIILAHRNNDFIPSKENHKKRNLLIGAAVGVIALASVSPFVADYFARREGRVAAQSAMTQINSQLYPELNQIESTAPNKIATELYPQTICDVEHRWDINFDKLTGEHVPCAEALSK